MAREAKPSQKPVVAVDVDRPTWGVAGDFTGDLTGEWSTVGQVSAAEATRGATGDATGDATGARPEWLGRLAIGMGAALLGMAVLSAVGLTLVRSRIERRLTQQTEDALLGAGLSQVQVEFVGRDATVRIPVGADPQQVASFVRTAANPAAGTHIAGPRSVLVIEDPSLGEVITTVNEWDKKVRASVKEGGDVLLEGLVQEDAGTSAMQSGVGAQLPGAVVVSQLQVNPTSGVVVSTAKWIGQIAGELGRIGNGDGSVEYDNEKITIIGSVATVELRDSLASFASQSGFVIDNKLSVQPDQGLGDSSDDDSGETGPVPFEEGVATPEAAVAQQTIDAILQQQTIEFTSGSAELTERGFSVVTQIAAVLQANSSVTLGIVGHTDSKGSPEANLVLSIERAETVRRVLEGKGVGSVRLTASGQGDTQPVSTNDTAEGRRNNRRIDLRVGQ
jgi:OmpA-OmpF porin, OOP family